MASRNRVSFNLHDGRFRVGESKIDLTDLPVGTREATLTPGDFNGGYSSRITLTYYRTSSYVSKRVANAFLADSKALEAFSKTNRTISVLPRPDPSPQRIYIYLKGADNVKLDYRED